LYYKVRREWEASQTDYEMRVQENERTKDEQNQNHEIEISNLNSKISSLQSTVEETSEVERLRVTQREKVELELKVRSLLGELDQVRYQDFNLVLKRKI
jgi:TolA-binding protein